MAFVQAAPFTFRDFIQQILPGLIAAGLFVPFAGVTSTESTFIAAALLSYVISTPVSLAANCLKLIPFLRAKLKELDADRKWEDLNWNYTRLFYRLSDEEREYTYLTGAYMQFYKVSAFYFLLYSCTQVGIIVHALWNKPYRTWGALASAAKTPILGGLSLPTLWILPLASVICGFLIADYINEYKILMFDLYPEYARRYQEKEGGIARSIWGKIVYEIMDNRGTKKEEPVSQMEVALTGEGTYETVVTDLKGRFQFRDKYEVCTKAVCTLRVDRVNQATKEIPVDCKWTPPINIVLGGVVPPSTEPQPGNPPTPPPPPEPGAGVLAKSP
jgi:hypothetical protein